MIAAAFDSSWKSTGFALCDRTGPLLCRHLHLDSSWRWATLAPRLRALDLEILPVLLEVDDEPRVVIERAPSIYSGRGNQADTGWGMGALVGPIAVHFAREGWGYPWMIPPSDKARKSKKTGATTIIAVGWRGWWGITGSRAKAKAHALALVRHHWRHVLRPEWGTDPEGPCGDVAEAILMGVGACRHPQFAPVGPRA